MERLGSPALSVRFGQNRQLYLDFLPDEEEAEDIVKGFRIEVGLKKSIKLIVTDGFDLEFSFELESFDKDYMKRFQLLKASM